MPKDTVRNKFYAVLHGRGGSKIYDNSEEYQAAIIHFCGASGKSFFSLSDARHWLERATEGQALLNLPRPAHPREPPSKIKVEAAPPPRKQFVNAAVQYSPPPSPPPILRPLPSPILDVLCPPPVVPPPPIQLSSEQEAVLKMVLSGKSLFFTGPAGTGKSVLLREIIRQLQCSYPVGAVGVTAPTGIAGLNINGSTLHSWAGIGLGKEEAHTLAKKIMGSWSGRRWKAAKVLIIDEVSMLDGNLFDKLEYIARAVRHSEMPFGGLQLVLSGDFFQLPPVPEQSHQHSMPATFAFDAISWSKCIPTTIFLRQVFRQTDNTFIDILGAMRQGRLEVEHIQTLQSLCRPLVYTDGIEPSVLYPLKRDVETCNNGRLAVLEGPQQTYHAMDSAGCDVRHERISVAAAEVLLDRLVAPAVVTLKIGAQVMLIQNVLQGKLVNGSAGKVIEFLSISDATKRAITIAQNPQQDTSERAQNYPRSFVQINTSQFQKTQLWPLVRFTNGLELLCAPVDFSVEGILGNIEALRVQVPLILSWALSIHKSQGQTLPRVKVDLGRIFEKGQAYVALSRATSMADLEILNFHPAKVMAHNRVLAWQHQWSVSQEQHPIDDEMDGEDAIMQYWEVAHSFPR